MARINNGIKVLNPADTVPTDAEGGYAGGDSTAAAVAQVGGVAAAVSERAAAGILAAAWDGPILTQAAIPDDDTALWISDDDVVRQNVGGSAPAMTTNHTRQTSTYATTGYTVTNGNSLRMDGGRVTMTTNTGLVAPILRMDSTTYGAQVTPGQAATLSADVGGGAVGHDSTYLLRIVWKDAGGTALSSVNGSTSALTTAGERRIVTATAPASAAFLTWQIVGVGAANGAADVWVTRVAITFDTTTAYVDGDTPGYTWTGAPGLSVSIPEDTGPWRVVSTIDGLLRKKGVSGSGGSVDPWLAHAVRRDTMRHRRGGTLGTSGKQVVAVRLDHGTQQAIDKGIIARLEQHAIPYHLACCAEHNTAVSPLEVAYPWSTIRSMSATGGCEVGNHSLTHGQATGTAQLTSEIVAGLAGIQAQVPDQAIEVWTQPGVGGTQYDGWNYGADLNAIITTEAGRMLLQHHAVVMGARDRQFWQVLDGTETVALAAWFVDQRRPSEIIAHVEAARTQSPAVGGVLALHPVQLDRGGSFQTTAEALEWIDWLAAERDAGRVELLTHAGLAIASSRDDVRPALVVKSGTVTAGGSLVAQPTIASIARHPYGAMWEAVTTLTATATGDITLTVTTGALSSTVTKTVTAGQTVTVRRHLTLPQAGASGVTATLAATGGATVADLRVQAV